MIQIMCFTLSCGDSPDQLIREFDVTREALLRDVDKRDLLKIEADYNNWNDETKRIWNRRTLNERVRGRR